MVTLRLGWRLLGSRQSSDRLSIVLSITAVAVSMTILLLTLGVNTGLLGRAERAAWRSPEPAPESTATAVEAVSTDFIADRPMVIVDLARLAADPPVPPGMSHFPEPGEVWVSPALRAAMTDQPADQLRDRIVEGGGAIAGGLGPAALVHPEELVAVVGRQAGDPAMTAVRRPDPRRDGDVATATPITGFSHTLVDFSPAALYVGLGRVAAVLVVVPLLVLGGAAARLSVTRRDQRLAILRLLGATPHQVVALTAVEAVATATAGTVLGTACYAVLLPPAAALVTIGGGSFLTSQLWLGWPLLGAVAIAAPALVGLSAVVGLRQLIISPLGVAHRHQPAALKLVRLLIFAAVLLGYTTVVTGADVSLTSVLVVLGAAFLALTIIGPWVLGILGRIVAARAKTIVMLLAGRRLIDDPRSAWRVVGGITLAAFVAGFLTPYGASSDTAEQGAADQLIIAAPAGRADHLAAQARQRLATAGIAATVNVTEDLFLGSKPDRRVVTVTLADTTGGADAVVDRARTLLHQFNPGQPAVTAADVNWRDRQFSADYRTMGLAVLAAAFAIAAASAAIINAANVLDQRRTIQLLYLAGTPLRTLRRAQTAQLAVPLAVTGGGALLVGLACAAPYTLLNGAPINVGGLTVLAVCLVAGTVAMVGAIALSRPLMRSLCRQPDPSATT